MFVEAVHDHRMVWMHSSYCHNASTANRNDTWFGVRKEFEISDVTGCFIVSLDSNAQAEEQISTYVAQKN
jgi:hypothetical protein